MKTNELPRKKSRLLRITTKNEDQTLVQNNGLEAKISKEETRTLPTIDLEEVPILVTRISLRDQTLHMGTTIRIMEDHMINAQISHSIEVTEIDLGMDLSTIRMGIGVAMETLLVLHQLKGETFHKIAHTASQEVISLTILLSADLTVDLQPGLQPTNKTFLKLITRRQLKLFVSLRPTIPLTNYQTSVG